MPTIAKMPVGLLVQVGEHSNQSAVGCEARLGLHAGGDAPDHVNSCLATAGSLAGVPLPDLLLAWPLA